MTKLIAEDFFERKSFHRAEHTEVGHVEFGRIAEDALGVGAAGYPFLLDCFNIFKGEALKLFEYGFVQRFVEA